MPRYYLKSPRHPANTLREITTPGQRPSYYYCSTSGTFYALFWRDTDAPRTLHQLDPATGTIALAPIAEVPHDWEGEPQLVRVAKSHWEAAQQRGLMHDNLWLGLPSVIRNGDLVVVVADNDPLALLGRVLLDPQGQPVFKPL